MRRERLAWCTGGPPWPGTSPGPGCGPTTACGRSPTKAGLHGASGTPHLVTSQHTQSRPGTPWHAMGACAAGTRRCGPRETGRWGRPAGRTAGRCGSGGGRAGQGRPCLAVESNGKRRHGPEMRKRRVECKNDAGGQTFFGALKAEASTRVIEHSHVLSGAAQNAGSRAHPPDTVQALITNHQ